jgi:DNA (cytosine-5)-methyltransferase 1
MSGGRPRLLDLFCGAGGAAVGYARAGFEVVGVDVEPQPSYPFEFVQMDALDFMADDDGQAFDVIHASPPCKVHTSLRAFSGAHHVNLIPQTRAALASTGLPYVIENVPGAPLVDPLVLCGSSFGLGVRRHRLFESNIDLTGPSCDHGGQAARSPGYPVKRYHSGKPVVVTSPVVGVFGRGQGLGPGEFDLWCKAMDIDWMTRDEMAQAIPPAYTRHLGGQLFAEVPV